MAHIVGWVCGVLLPEDQPPGDDPPDGGQGAEGAARPAPLTPNLELREVRRGTKPGSRYVRLTPKRELPFRRVGEGEFQATEVALRPRSSAERVWLGFKRIVVGAPLATSELEEQKISKIKALAVFSSDVLSSSAYATDEILLVLVAAGTGALTHSIEVAVAIGILLAIVTLSYRQTIRAYPNGGGAYIVSRENLGDTAALTAASALSVDYILTVAVSVAAGIFAITSAFPELNAYSVELSIAVIAFVTLANIRGIRESSTIFAVPTYAFIFAFATLLIGGFIRIILDPGLEAPVVESAVPAGTAALGPLLLLRAFASGSAALTGTEAISNGIPAFKKPESQNAAVTLMWMALILGSFFIGLTVLAHQLGVRHADEISVPAQVAKTVFGGGLLFYIIQAATALILLLAANTSYADFPRLASILAKDKFLPHQFTFRGDRLAFSHGIVVLGLAATALLIVFDADVDRLIPLYAFGVFVSFTLSQSGMVIHWLRLREPGWKGSIVMNAVGAAATFVVALIIGGTKFIDGAWISMCIMAILALAFAAVHAHYRSVTTKLEVQQPLKPARSPPAGRDQGHTRAIIMPVDELNRAVLHTLAFARSFSDNVTAVHITDELEEGEALREAWERTVPDTPIVIIESPYRSFVAPMLTYIDAIDSVDPGAYITVVLPEFVPEHFWQGWLHNQSAGRLKRALQGRPNTVIINVPYHLAT
jgi:amino acid transporter